MATDSALRSVTNTLTSTTADTITLTQLWTSIRVTNHASSTWLYVTPDGDTAVAEADNTIAVPPGQSRSFMAQRAEGTNTIVVGVVGDGNQYTIEGTQGGVLESLEDLTAEVDALQNATSDAVWMLGTYFRNGSASPSFSNTGATQPAWLLDPTADESVIASVMVPPNWATFNIELRWFNPSTSTGDVMFWPRWNNLGGQGTNIASLTNGASKTFAAGGQNIEQVTTLETGVAVNPAFPVTVRLLRLAADVADTLAADIAVRAIVLRKAS